MSNTEKNEKPRKAIKMFHDKPLSELDDVRFVERAMSLYLLASGKIVGEIPCESGTVAVQLESDFWQAKKAEQED